MLTWLPTYLVLERHLSVAMMAGSPLYYLVDRHQHLNRLASGLLDSEGYTPTLVRKSAMAIDYRRRVAITGLRLPANKYVPWLMAAGVGCGMTAPGIFALPRRWPARNNRKVYGAQNGFSTRRRCGTGAHGFVLERTGNFVAPFAITAALCIVGGSPGCSWWAH